MESEKKIKMVYSGELLVFALIFAVLGTLILTHVWVLGGTFRSIFIYVTLAGSTWFFIDFVWTLSSKKRQAKNSLLDKALPLPATGTILVTDIISLVTGLDNTKELHHYVVGSVFVYFALVYIIEGLYHYKHPIPLILEEIEESKKAAPKNNDVLYELPEEDGADKEEK